MPLLTQLLLIIAVFLAFFPFVIVVGLVVRMLRKGESPREAFQALVKAYRETRSEFESRKNPTSVVRGRRFSKSSSLFSPAECKFHKALCAAVPDLAIFAKVRVADVVHAKERYSGDFLRISQKHFDWLICHPESFEPLIAIELDDSSHRTNQRQVANDTTKNSVALDADLSLLRFAWQQEYDAEKLRETIVNEVNAITDRS